MLQSFKYSFAGGPHGSELIVQHIFEPFVMFPKPLLNNVLQCGRAHYLSKRCHYY